VDTYAYACQLESMPIQKNLKWVWVKDLEKYPMGKIDRQIAHLVQNASGT
jgi:hypothetical protein